jgi:hypothetical protein
MKRSPIGYLFAATILFAACGNTPGSGPGADSDRGSGGSGGSGGRGGSAGTGGKVSAGGGSGGAGGASTGSGGAGGSASGSGGGSGGNAGDAGGGTATGGSAGTGGAGAGDGDAGAETAAPPPGPADGGAASITDGGTWAIPPGMTNLFDGTSLDGWTGNPAVWKLNATDRAIEGITPESNGGTYFYTKGDYDDFRVVVTERAVATMNHMGLCFWGGRGGTGANGCLDVIPPSGSIWDYGDGGQKPGGVGSANNPIKFMWHQVEILASAATGEILVAVNGKQTTTYKKAGRAKKGPFGLQAHAKASHQQYRDIWIEANPKERRLLTVKP